MYLVFVGKERVKKGNQTVEPHMYLVSGVKKKRDIYNLLRDIFDIIRCGV